MIKKKKKKTKERIPFSKQMGPPTEFANKGKLLLGCHHDIDTSPNAQRHFCQRETSGRDPFEGNELQTTPVSRLRITNNKATLLFLHIYSIHLKTLAGSVFKSSAISHYLIKDVCIRKQSSVRHGAASVKG